MWGLFCTWWLALSSPHGIFSVILASMHLHFKREYQSHPFTFLFIWINKRFNNRNFTIVHVFLLSRIGNLLKFERCFCYVNRVFTTSHETVAYIMKQFFAAVNCSVTSYEEECCESCVNRRSQKVLPSYSHIFFFKYNSRKLSTIL